MDAIGALGGTRISRGMMAAVGGVIAALLLGGAGGYFAKSLTGESGVTPPAPSGVVQPQGQIGTGNYYRARHSGLQTGENQSRGSQSPAAEPPDAAVGPTQ